MSDDKALVPYVPQQPAPYYPQQQPIIIQGGRGGAGSTILIIGGLLVLGVGGYLIYKALNPGIPDMTGDLEFSVQPEQVTVAPGTNVKANVSVTNISQKAVSPSLRFDIKNGTGGWTQVNENPDGFMDFGSIAAGDTVTKEMSMTIPSNWGTLSAIYGRLILHGHSGTVWTDLIATVPAAGSLTAEVTPVKTTAAKGDTFTVDVTFTNPNDSDMAIRACLDLQLRDHSWTPAQSELNEGVIVTVPANGTKKVTLISDKVPTNWDTNSEVAGRIIIYPQHGAADIIWGDTTNYVFTVGESMQLTYLTINSLGIDGLKAKCIPTGGQFSYNIPCNNTSGGAMLVDFIVGFRDHTVGNTYSELRTKISVPAGAKVIPVLSPKANFNASNLDLRVLVAKKANVVVSNGEGDGTAEDGTVTDIIYEGAGVVYCGVAHVDYIVVGPDGKGLLYEPNSRVPANGVISNGADMSLNLFFKHVGPETLYKCVAFIKTNAGTLGGYWLPAAGMSVRVPEAVNWEHFEITLSGKAIIPTALGSGRTIAVSTFVLPNSAVVSASGITGTPLLIDSDVIFSVQ